MEKQDKLTMHTKNLTDVNFAVLADLFPNAITETITGYNESGEAIIARAVDADILAQEINTHVVSGKEERYQFTWPDKKKSVLLANAPIAATLRPCREESVDFNNTENLYIEGDNLDVLKLLRETYLNRVKMVYLDPPYNTGTDLIYRDDFAEDANSFLRRDLQYDEQGNRLSSNFDSNGRFHTDWLNMMYPRLRVARDLLTDDGVVFISIDDGEIRNLRNICDEVFGESNFVACLVWQRIHSTKNDAKYFSENHEYIVCYAKSISNINVGLLPRTSKMNERYKNPDNDPRGPWQSGDLVASGERRNGHFIVKSPATGREFDVPQGKHWVYSEENLKKLVDENQIWFGIDGNSFPRKKRFLSDVQDGRTPNTLWLSDEVGHNQSATREVAQIFEGSKFFDFPKPVDLIKRCILLFTNNNDLILDFFSGSATTAHAVMKLNAEDGHKRKFIMIQVPEETPEGTPANEAKYLNICEIGKERIRRAGIKIKEETGLMAQNLDIGFRVLKLDSSNMKEVYYTPEEYSQTGFNLEGFMDNIKPDRSDEDLLFQVMLDLGIPISAKIEQIGTIFNVNNNYLLACFDRVDTSMITEIAQKQPNYAVFRDSSFLNDSALVNVEQVFNTYSPNTIRRVL